MDKPNTQKPVEVIRDGAIKASLWRNEGENGPYLSVSFARTYTKDGKAHDSGSFTGRDLLVVSELARQAYCTASYHRTVQNEMAQ